MMLGDGGYFRTSFTYKICGSETFYFKPMNTPVINYHITQSTVSNQPVNPGITLADLESNDSDCKIMK